MNAVMVVQDRFMSAGEVANQPLTTKGWANTPFIRRPTRGIQIKQDTFATIRLVAGIGGKNIPLVDAGSNRLDVNNQPITINGLRATDIYSNFLLQHVSESRMEKIQVLETFGEPYIFLYGERPRVVTFQGILLNTQDFNWEAEWWWNYDNYLRGTKAVENDARAFIAYDTTLVSGYIISASAEKDSGNPYYLQFQFQLFLTDYSTFSNLGNPNAQPGLSLAITNSGNNQTPSQAIAAAAAASVFSPTAIPASGPTSIDIEESVTQGTHPTLAEGFADAVAVVSAAWNNVQSVVKSSLIGVAQALLTGSSVRIPYGFEGDMAFDDADAIPLLTQPQYGLSTKYGVYSDNTDEYVGVGSQYGSSETPAGVFRVPLPSQDPNLNLSYTNQMIETAIEIWGEAGVAVQPSSMSSTSSSILGKAQGLIASAATTIGATSLNPGSAAGPFAGSLPGASGLPV